MRYVDMGLTSNPKCELQFLPAACNCELMGSCHHLEYCLMLG